jgi:hypothetical protein
LIKYIFYFAYIKYIYFILGERKKESRNDIERKLCFYFLDLDLELEEEEKKHEENLFI